ncbi:MAG: glycosyltransferase [Candidatus Omnitrophica bacterium]|nr:glycosyltransferase [Candidatus Omnitrophota bacterium]
MKKLLFVTHEQFWPLTGGCTAGNFHILKYLAQNGFEVAISTPLFVDVSSLSQKYGFKFESFSPYYMHRKVKFRMVKYVVYGFLSTFHLIRVLFTNRYDVIYVNNAILAFPFIFIKPFLKIPVVIRYTDFLSGFLGEDKKYPKLVVRFLRFYELRVAGIFDKVFVITDRMKQSLCHAGGIKESKVILTFDGVDGNVFNPGKLPDDNRQVIRKKLDIPLEAKLVMFHGTIEPHHGEGIIVDIIKKLLEKSAQAHVLLIGVGSGYDKIQKALKDDLRVHMLDFVSYNEIPLYIDASDVGMIPYPKNESMDMVLTLKLLEYLSLGVRCVTFDLESIKDTFRNKDFIKTSKNAEEFIFNIIEMLEKGRSKEAIEIIGQGFTWDKVAERIRQELPGESF